MSSQVNIRTLTIDDLATCEASFPEPFDVSYRQQIDRQSPEGYSLYGLFSGDQLAAMAHVRRQGPKDQAIGQAFPCPVIGNLYVLPDFRKQGLGQMLLNHIEAVLRDESRDTVGLIVSCQNNQAIRLYEQAGYQPIRQFPARPGRDEHPRLYYTKNLHI